MTEPQLPGLAEIARKLGGEVCGQHVLAPGPGHSPQDRSLQVTLSPTAPDGFLVHSFASDDDLACKDFVRSKLGLADWKPNGRGNGRTDHAARHDRVVIRIHDYTDRLGELLYQKLRYAPKGFSVRRRDGHGGWLWNLDGVPRVLYRQPELVEALAQDRHVFIAEGEKAVDALVKLGVPATCSGGANSWDDRFAEDLRGANVIILPDNDDPGRKHAHQIAKSLSGVAASIKVLHLPGLPEHGDAYDWIAAGGTAGSLWKLVETEAREWKVEPPASAGALVVRCSSDIKPEKIDWLWEQRLPLGKNVLVAGEGGLGKSMALAWIAATVSRGGEWPCGEGISRRGSVIILSAEDDAADTIVPRLMAADAELARVYIFEAVRTDDDNGIRTFNLQHDLMALEQKIAELGDVVLVIIDPITSYLGKVDSHKNAELRSVLEPLGKMAARQHVTVIANTHLSKATGGNANSRVIGSVAFVNHARAAFIVTLDPEDSGRRLFIPSKTNLGRQRDGLAYRIADTVLPSPDGSVLWAPFVQWEDAPITISADQAVAANAGGLEGKSTLEEAKRLLSELLAGGKVAAKEVKEVADAHMISVATLRRAKSALGVIVSREGFGPGSSVLWGLPHRCSKSP